MALHALCVGINDYRGPNLSGCVNDARDWGRALGDRGFEVAYLLDQDATRAAMVEAMQAVLTQTRRGDTAVITYSGHGTKVPDHNGDEPDHFDEALCPADTIATGKYLTDDTLYELFADRAPGAKVVLVADSCNSGTVSRFAGPLIPKKHLRKIRFLPPVMFMDADDQERARGLPSLAPAAPVRHPGLLMSGCADPEYSYDAWFNGRPNGAFTRVALDTLNLLGDSSEMSYRAWHREIRMRLPSEDYGQTPQLYGTTAQKNWRVLA